MSSVKEARKCKKLSISQREAVIELIEKKDRDKSYIKNWCLICLLNVNYQIMSKALVTRLKETHPGLISCQQTARRRRRSTNISYIRNQ